MGGWSPGEDAEMERSKQEVYGVCPVVNAQLGVGVREEAGVGSRRNWAAVQSQQRTPPTPRGALELGWPLRAVPNGDKRAGS